MNYRENMNGTRVKIGVSESGRLINETVCEAMKEHGESNHSLAAKIGRSDKYIRDRTGGDKEWAISDLERLCELWKMPLECFLANAATATSPLEETLDRRLDDRETGERGKDEENDETSAPTASPNTEDAPTGKRTTFIATLSDEELIEELNRRLAQIKNGGDYTLAANRDPHKYEEMQGGEGR